MMQFDWRDERVGFWSTVARSNDCVAFQPTGTYLRGRIVGLAFAVGVAWMFLGPPLKTGSIFDFSVFAIIAIMAASIALRGSKSPIPLTVFDCEVPEEAAATLRARRISARSISAIVVRENTGRTPDDMRMAQMYFVLKKSELPVLAYQKSFDQRDEVRSVSRELSERWGVRLLDTLS